MEFNESGWLFSDDDKDKIHNISNEEIYELIELADEERKWQDIAQKELLNKVPMNQREILQNYLNMWNAKGTIMPNPFGGNIITFSSTRHFFRGENQIFPKSIPSLNRRIDLKNEKDKEIYRTIANLRIIRFKEFIKNFDIISLWETKLSDINYKALAQHYGFETSLLDLTNDFNIALFFATCKYNETEDCYRPLTNEDIEKSKETKYGVIYHCPNWKIDFFQQMFRVDPNKKYEIDDGQLDGIAFQIGFQPFMRCSFQSAYIFPMRNSVPLQLNKDFEKIHFKQSQELSEKVFKMMEEGKKVIPFEGISKAKKIIDEIKNTLIFTKDDLKEVYCNEVNKKIFLDFDDFKESILKYEINGQYVKIVDKIKDCTLNKELIQSINEQYNDIDLLEYIGRQINYFIQYL